MNHILQLSNETQRLMDTPINATDVLGLLPVLVISSGFMATLYTFVAKDTKLKASSGTILQSLFLICAGIILLVGDLFLVYINYQPPIHYILIITLVIFTISWSLVTYTFAKSHVRLTRLKEQIRWHYYPPFSWCHKTKYPHYELNRSKPVSINLKSIPIDFETEEKEKMLNGYSFLFIGDYNTPLDIIALKFLIDGLEQGETTNYVCVNRHPSIIYSRIKELYPNIDTKNLDSSFIIIDAFTPNYGFFDEVNISQVKRLTKDGVKVINGKTLPGIHTAAAKAFQLTKEYRKNKEGRETRLLHRMVYDGISTLEHLSSVEDIKVFFNHVIPSERNYEMLTCIVEDSTTNPEILDTLKQLVDCVFEIKLSEDKINYNMTKPRIVRRLVSINEVRRYNNK